MTAVATFWADVLGVRRPEWLSAIRADTLVCEARRQVADYNTGTVPEASAVVLRALCEAFRPETVVEIGTFIGTSALAMLGCKTVKRIYTCDSSNDCGHIAKAVKTYPKTKSTTMLRALVGQGVKADLFFFDGRIQDADCEQIVALSKPGTVYAFDDYEHQEKGVINVLKLAPFVPGHLLTPPPASVWALPTVSTIAVLAR